MWNSDFVKACFKAVKQRAFYKDYWATFNIVEANTTHLRDASFYLRYQLYCEKNLFFDKKKFVNKLEKDSFDERAVHHLLLNRRTGEAVGTVRVLLPDPARPLTSFEMQKYCDHPMLQLENRVMGMCEISRFCMAPQYLRRPRDGNFLPAYYEQEWNDEGNKALHLPFFRRRIPYAPLGLLKAAFKTALEGGLTNCVMFVETKQIKTLKRLGIDYRVLGPRIDMCGMQQPIILNIKTSFDHMESSNRECWEIMTEKGLLHDLANSIYQYDWQDTIFETAMRNTILRKLI